MPALKPTDYFATIIWLGAVPPGEGDIRSQTMDRLEIGFDGPKGERHAGLTRASCSRVLAQHPRGTEIANTRQLAVVSEEEMAVVAARLGLERIDPRLTGATMVVNGIADLSHLPPSSRLQAADGTTLVVDMENRPCVLPAREIERDHPGQGKGFKAAAQSLRGVTAWVERPGQLALGDRLRLHIPDQMPWAPMALDADSLG